MRSEICVCSSPSTPEYANFQVRGFMKTITGDINILKNMIEIDVLTAAACALKFVFFLLIVIAAASAVLVWELLGYAIGAVAHLDFLIIFLIFILMLSAVIMTNSFWDAVIITSNIKPKNLNLQQIFNSFSSIVKTKALILLTVSAGIAYIPLFYYLGIDLGILANSIRVEYMPSSAQTLASGYIIWLMHAGIVLFLTRYADAFAIYQPDPFTNIKNSIELIKNNLLESITFSLLEIASAVGMLAAVSYVTNIYAALVITSMLYFLTIKPVFSKISIQIVKQQSIY